MNTKTASKPRHIETAPVKSSAIEAIGHDPETNTLRVKFVSGGLYDVAGVTAKQHQALMKAKSPGAHFNEHIRVGGQITKVAA